VVSSLLALLSPSRLVASQDMLCDNPLPGYPLCRIA